MTPRTRIDTMTPIEGFTSFIVYRTMKDIRKDKGCFTSTVKMDKIWVPYHNIAYMEILSE